MEEFGITNEGIWSLGLPWALVAMTVLMMFMGGLITRRELEGVERDKEAYKLAGEKQQEIIKLQAEQLEQLTDQLFPTITRIVDALPSLEDNNGR